MTRRLVLAAALLVLALAPFPHDAGAGEPTDQLRDRIERLYRVTQGPGGASMGNREVEQILDELFDWRRMAEASLRQHWQARTEAQRAEFTSLFSRLFRRAYLSRIHVVDATGFRYLGDKIANDLATVRTNIATKRGTPLEVDYAVRLDQAQRWRVEDVRVERVSLMESYRAQFDTVIARSSYDGLVAKLREAAR